jgi:hypothetical protein
MRATERSVRLAAFCAVILVGAAGFGASGIDWPAPASARAVAVGSGAIDWPVPASTQAVAAGPGAIDWP